MDGAHFDRMAKELAGWGKSRRGLLRAAGGSALGAGLAPHWARREAAAACRAPKKPCDKGGQCCTGKCKQGRCVGCANGAIFIPAPDLLCWGGWGGNGSGNGQFKLARGVAVGGNRRVYVADTENHRLQVFDPDGRFLRKWGSQGSGPGQFFVPFGVTVGRVPSGDGHVYVADTFNSRIQEFDATGGFVRMWGRNGGDGTSGSGDGEFNRPRGVAVGRDDHVYVADFLNHRIQEFDADGRFVRTWGSFGSSTGQFNQPWGVAVGDRDHVYVVDFGNNRVQEFDATGSFVRTWGRNGGDGTAGSGDGEFDEPTGVAVGGSGHVYIVDARNYRVQKFDPNGDFVRTLGSEPSEYPGFIYPAGVAVGGHKQIYVADEEAGLVRMQVL